jgi:hypothetical protein
MKTIVKWFHHLFNPHCLQCIQELKDKNFCRSCETLQYQLEIERARVNQLLNQLAAPQVKAEVPIDLSELKPIPTGRKFVPFAVKQQMREEQDNRTLEVLQQRWREVHAPIPTVSNVINTVEGTEKLVPNSELEKELLEFDVMHPNNDDGMKTNASAQS